MWTDGGEFDYYFINGPELDAVARRYTQLTGLPELPPLWSLGYHQCRWSYYPEARVKEVAATFREKQIPCDAIYLDIDYMGWLPLLYLEQGLLPRSEADDRGAARRRLPHRGHDRPGYSSG